MSAPRVSYSCTFRRICVYIWIQREADRESASSGARSENERCKKKNRRDSLRCRDIAMSHVYFNESRQLALEDRVRVVRGKTI